MIVGEWQLDRVKDSRELQVALARAFGLEDSRVLVVSSLMEAPSVSGSHLICVPTVRSGQFPWGLSLYAIRLDGDPSEPAVAGSVAGALGCSCLVPDESLDPYLRYLVSGDGIRLVSLDVEKLDERDEFWVEE